MYVQRDGIAMGSPLGPLFANFYMGSVEEKVFTQHPNLKPALYTRYVDDIFLDIPSEDDVLRLAQTFKQNSVLNFTHEIEQDQKLPFLDILIERHNTSFSTEVYVKSTNLGFCLNGASECPQKYHRSVINSFVRRALTHSTTTPSIKKELNRITQLLINNGYDKKKSTTSYEKDCSHIIRSHPLRHPTRRLKKNHHQPRPTSLFTTKTPCHHHWKPMNKPFKTS